MSFSGITGLYYIEARHWDHDSIVTDGNTLGEAMNDLYEILENTIK